MDTLAAWHKLLKGQDASALDELLAEQVVFHSPIMHTPVEGKEMVSLYLSAAFFVLFNPSFKYIRQVSQERDAILEFQTEVDGIIINGVDMMHWNESGQIDDFKVMLRPLKAVNLIHQKMKEMLEMQSQQQQ